MLQSLPKENVSREERQAAGTRSLRTRDRTPPSQNSLAFLAALARNSFLSAYQRFSVFDEREFRAKNARNAKGGGKRMDGRRVTRG
jgi:hypothetical protein